MAVQVKDRISLRDEGCKIVQGPHPGFWGRTIMTAQHPCGLKFQIEVPNGDSEFSPCLIDYLVEENLGKGDNADEREAIAGVKCYLQGLSDPEEPGHVNYGMAVLQARSFFHGYMSCSFAKGKSGAGHSEK
jgi:hypothetical protein